MKAVYARPIYKRCCAWNYFQESKCNFTEFSEASKVTNRCSPISDSLTNTMSLWQYLISHHIKSAVFIQTRPTSVNDPSTLLPSPTHILARGSLLSFYKRSTSTQEVASADICESNYSSTALIHRFWWYFFYCVLWDNLSSLQGVLLWKSDRIRSNHGKVTVKNHTVEHKNTGS